MYKASVVVLVIAPQSICAPSEPRENVLITTCEAARRSVSEIPAAAAAPSAAVIPGTISKSNPALRSASISSPARPKISESPPFNRMTTSCFVAADTSQPDRSPNPLKPQLVLRPELLFELQAKTLRKRGTLAVGGNSDLQVAALHDRAIVKMAVLDVVHGIAQNSARVSLAKNSFVNAGRGRSSDNQICAVEVRGSKRLCPPFHFSLRDPLGDCGRHLRRDNANASLGRKKALSLSFLDASAADNHNQAISKLHENGQQAHASFRLPPAQGQPQHRVLQERQILQPAIPEVARSNAARKSAASSRQVRAAR